MSGTQLLTKRAPGAVAALFSNDLSFDTASLWNDLTLKPVSIGGQVSTTGLVVSSPLDGTLSLSGSKDVKWAIGWDAPATGSFVGGALVFPLSLGTLTLTPTTTLPVALTGAESTQTVHLAHKRYQTQAAFAAAVQTALDGLLPGSDIIVTPAGADIQIHSNLGATRRNTSAC